MKKYIPLFFLLIIIFSCQSPNTTTTQTEDIKVTKRKVDLKENRYNVAFLIMDGVFNTELTAPYDIFQHTIFRDSIKAMNTFLVANTLNPITSFEGIRLLPDYNYLSDDLPPIDILVVPSAEHHLDTDLEDEAMINFVKKVDKTAKYITSHCDGAFVLAKAGVLDNVACTTFPSDIGKFRKMFPQLDVREDVLFVHDGKYITSAGGAKSFEAALYLSEIMYGKKIAQSLAGGLVIDWQMEAVPKVVIEK